jgi:tetratricopeptide (TPR) repeat protein
MSERTLHRLLAVLMFLTPFVVFLRTMAATVSLWDSGEFISTSYILGIAHSPGTPLFTLVGRVFAMLPLPLSIAQRVNFLSVLLAAFAVLMTYYIMVATIRFMYGEAKGGLGRFIQYAGPVVGCLYLTFSDTFWKDSTETEVYSLIAFVTALCTWLALAWYKNPAGYAATSVTAGAPGVGGDQRPKPARASVRDERPERGHARGIVYLIIYLMALGIAFHLGTVLVYGAIVLFFLLVKDKAFTNSELIIGSFGLAVLVADMTLYRSVTITIIGLVIYAILVAWSTARQGRFALAAAGLIALGISVHLYLYIRSHLNPEIDMVDPETWKALHYHLRREQYPPMNMFVRKAPLLWQLGHFGRYMSQQFRMFGDLMIGRFNLGQAATAIPVALGLAGIAANYNRERKTWALNFANLVINSLGLILFLNFSANEVRERDYFYAPGFHFFAIFIGIGATALLAWTADALRARGREVVRYVVPLGSLLIVLSILPARYNWFSHDRSHDYFTRDYGYNVLASLEPDAIIFTFGDNDTYPLWYMQCVERFRTDVRVANASLLNTEWYIRQLRDREPKVPIALNNRQIDDLQPVALEGGGIAWKNDLITQHIIQATQWKRPIYFASTCKEEFWRPYDNYLERQGLVMRLVPYKGKDMFNEFILQRDLDEIYLYRGIMTRRWVPDTTSFKDEDGLDIILVNYAVAMGQLAYLKSKEKNYAEAARRMEMAIEFTPKYKPGRLILGTYYLLAGEPQKAIDYYQRMIKEEPGEGEYWLRLATVYEVQGDLPTALQYVDGGIRNDPEFRPLYTSGFQYAARLGRSDAAKSYIRQWLQRHPDDQQIKDLYGQIDQVLKDEFGIEPGAKKDSMK